MLFNTLNYAHANPTLSVINKLITQKSLSTQTVSPRSQPSARYALVLFFSSRCPHCQRFVPRFMQLAHTLQLKVYAYSVDGQGLPGVDTPLLATPTVMHTFFVNTPAEVPTVFAINTKTLAFQLVSQGEVAQNVITERLKPIASSNRGIDTQRTRGFSYD